MSWTLRQRRYQAFALLMLVVALACIAIGTFEVQLQPPPVPVLRPSEISWLPAQHLP